MGGGDGDDRRVPVGNERAHLVEGVDTVELEVEVLEADELELGDGLDVERTLTPVFLKLEEDQSDDLLLTRARERMKIGVKEEDAVKDENSKSLGIHGTSVRNKSDSTLNLVIMEEKIKLDKTFVRSADNPKRRRQQGRRPAARRSARTV
jgi:hypothetical protein